MVAKKDEAEKKSEGGMTLVIAQDFLARKNSQVFALNQNKTSNGSSLATPQDTQPKQALSALSQLSSLASTQLNHVTWKVRTFFDKLLSFSW